jgi:hypothetical protein
VHLRTGSFQHRDDRVGRVSVPTFVVVGKTANNPNASPAADLNDKISDLL